MSGDHIRDTAAMRASLRCGARTRKGTPCAAPAVSGKRRCRMHGGAKGSAAPVGNQNALRHGLYCGQSKADRAALRDLIRDAKRLMEELRGKQSGL